MAITWYQIGWIVLAIFQIGVASHFIYLYKEDKDKRKLMFGMAFLIGVFAVFYLSSGYHGSTNEPVILKNIYYWSYIPILFSIFSITHFALLDLKNFRPFFNSFVFFVLISFLILAFYPYPASEAFAPVIGVLSFEVLVVSIALFIKNRNISDFIFLLAVLCFTLAGIATAMQLEPYFQIFSFFIGYVFFMLIFAYPSTFEKTKDKGMADVFAIKKQLSETTETFETLFHQMSDGVVITDGRGMILEVSKKMCDTLGYKRDEIVNTNFLKSSLMDEETKRELIKNILLRLAGKHIPPYEVTLFHKDGSPYPFELYADKIMFKGKPADMAVFRDIRSRKIAEKELHESETKYRTVFEKTGTAMGLFGEDSVITMANHKFEELSGYRKDEIEHKMHWYDFVPEDMRRKMFQYHQQRSAHQGSPPSEYDCPIADKNGKIKITHVSIGLIPGTTTRVVSLNDITELKKVHAKLHNLNKNLEKTVGERTQKINRLLKQKDDFINQLGHDLKNPLGPFLHLLPILKKHASSDKDRKMIEVLERNASYMQNLVKKTIELAKLNSEKTVFNFEKANLSYVIEEVIMANSSFFDKHDVVIINKVPSDVDVIIDVFQMEGVFTNLFNNAVKYADGSGKVIVEAKKLDDDVMVSLTDNGVGIDNVHIDYVFDEYYKVDGSRHDFDSSGLGLPICKRIIEKHGGKIWVESDGIGKGTTFYFTIPFTPVAEQKHLDETQCQYHEISDEIDTLLAEK